MYCSQKKIKEICEGAILTLKFQGNFILQTADRQNDVMPQAAQPKKILYVFIAILIML